MSRQSKISFLILVIMAISCFLVVSQVWAANPPDLTNVSDKLNDSAKEVKEFGQNQGSISKPISDIIQVVVGFVGVVLAIFIIYAGWLWLSAGGNEEQITKAKDILKNSFIALAIILGAWVITETVIKLVNAA